MAVIKFTFEQEDLAPITVNDAGVGESILDITEEYDIHLNHNCGAVCACSTCHVYVESGEEFVKEITDREEDFIDRARNPRLESRLGCQCVILEENAKLEVHIPDQREIIGHEH